MDIFKSNGQLFTILADGTTTTTADAPVILAGRNYAGYGKILNENSLKLAENFASDAPPAGPILGQVWYDTASNILRVYKGTTIGWKPFAIETVGVQTPQAAAVGDMWWDTSKDQLKVFSGTAWKVIAPHYEKNWGESGALPFVIKDTNNIEHICVKIVSGGRIMAIINQDAEFTPSTAMPGFSTVKNGINANSSIPSFKYHGTVTNSDSLGDRPAGFYVRTDIDNTINADLNVSDVLRVGTGVRISTQSGADAASIESTQSGKNLEFWINYNGTQTRALVVDGRTGESRIGASFTNIHPSTEAGIAHRGYVTNVRSEIEAQTQQLLDTLENEIDADIAVVRSRLDLTERDTANNKALIDEAYRQINTKAPINAPVFVGLVTADEPASSADNTQLPTTHWVRKRDEELRQSIILDHDADLAELRAEFRADLVHYAPIVTPTFRGEPSGPTPPLTDRSTRFATTDWVKAVLPVGEQRWLGSNKFVSTRPPTDADGEEGDIWFHVR
jgi:hypothetical protein